MKGIDAMKPRIAVLRNAIDSDIKKYKSDALHYATVWQ